MVHAVFFGCFHGFVDQLIGLCLVKCLFVYFVLSILEEFAIMYVGELVDNPFRKPTGISTNLDL